MLKIKKDDEVVVIAGRDKGKRGEVLKVLKDGRLLVGGVKRRQEARTTQSEPRQTGRNC